MQADMDTQLYCLQTMGIHPWVLRTQPAIVLLFESTRFTSAECILLDKMLSCVGLDSSEVEIAAYSDERLKQGGAIKLAHPADLLKNPLEKKAAYFALGALAR